LDLIAVKRVCKLRTSSRFRGEENSVLVVGQIPLSELCHEVPNLHLKTLLWAGPEGDMPAGTALPPFLAKKGMVAIKQLWWRLRV